MSPEAQRIAIAEACGWTKIGDVGLRGLHGQKPNRPLGCLSEVPDYLNDLNAMHEAESSLDKDQRRKWELAIAEMFSAPSQSWFDVCHMSAAQRAEAFLKTIGKWE